MQTVSELRKYESELDYATDRERIRKFILFYTTNGNYKYLEALRNMKDSFTIELGDLIEFDESGLALRFKQHAFSYMQQTAQVVDELLQDETETKDDAFLRHRLTKFKERYGDKPIGAVFPGFLLRNYVVRVIPLNEREIAVREVVAERIGQLVSVRGVVTRVSAVKPAVRVATYVCGSCGAETYQQIGADAFEMLEECSGEKCRARNVRGTLTLVARGSKFVRMQSVQLQELTGDAPHGCVPRSVSVECYADATEQCRPGECVIAHGVVLPRGYRRFHGSLLNDVFLMATGIVTSQPIGQPELGSISLSESKLDDTAGKPIEVSDLIKSFAPEIFGMDETKLVLLLLLVGAPALVRADGMRVRGDINALLLGDPGIAKSQLLKTAARISRRGIYATGRGSSGVGLTASVGKDPSSGEVVLDGGALVLADGGICCIDELDKMYEADRIAIHEVMEQQTVSIAKAGINTTLNARCSVLAAANPVRGRYDPKRTIAQNAGLPLSLLSRFDVVCVLRDEADASTDAEMADHIAALHCNSADEFVPPLSYPELRSFISRARLVDPTLPPQMRERLVSAYLGFRQAGSTPRLLLALIRLSLAHARLRLSPLVETQDVETAVQIIGHRIEQPVRESNSRHSIFNFIVSLVEERDGRRIVDLELLWARSPYARDTVEEVISAFESTGVWLRNNEYIEMLD